MSVFTGRNSGETIYQNIDMASQTSANITVPPGWNEKAIGDTLLQRLDFFELYGLNEYIPGANTSASFLGFLPIIIRSTEFYGKNIVDKSNDNKDVNIYIKVPWSPSEVSDSVSVNFSRRSGAATTLSEFVTKAVSNFSEYLANLLQAEYHPENLNKNLDIEFILPLNRRVNPDFIFKVRSYLGALQGLVYPRNFGFQYPPLLAVTFGGLYKGFKGFLREVNIRTSEEMIEVNGEMFPLLIRGSLRFTNVFLYTWSYSDKVKGMLGDFTLNNYPWILFGEDKGVNSISTTSMLAGSDYIINNTANNEALDTALYKVFKRGESFEGVDPVTEKWYKVYTNMKNFDTTGDFTNLNYDYDTSFTMGTHFSSIMEEINNDNFKFLGVDSDNDNVKLANSIQSIIGSVQDVSHYSNLLINIRDKNLFNILSMVSKIVGSSGTPIADTTRSIINIYWPILSMLTDVDTGLNLYNATDFYYNLSKLTGELDKIISNNNNASKDIFDEAKYINALYTERVANISSKFNSYLNSDEYINNTDMAPLNTLHASNMLLLQTEILKNADVLKDLNKKMYESACISGLYSDAELLQFKKAYELSNKIDTIQVKTINEVLSTNLNTIKGELA
jgi:hypothetical protein